MTENTKIEWATHSHNFWTGCEAVSPGCAGCYAETWAKRAGRVFADRKRTTAENWRKPLKWDRQAAADGAPARVFTNSLADFFDNKVPDEWRADAFALIRSTPNLHWLILTKRIGNAKSMIESAADWHFDHGDRNVCGWLTDWYRHGVAPANVWLGATVVNQAEAERDVRKLLAVPAHVRFLSCEPLLGPIDLAAAIFCKYCGGEGSILRGPDDFECSACEGRRRSPEEIADEGLDWVIAGGESGGKARLMHLAWARGLRDQCLMAGVPFLFKQFGEWAPMIDHDSETIAGKPYEILVDGYTAVRLGKKIAGRMLDGRTWDQFPEVT